MNQPKYSSSTLRHLSNLKLVSRLLGHELHAQSGAKTITFSRESVVELQTSIDLFIEELSRRQGQSGSLPSGVGNGSDMAGIRN